MEPLQSALDPAGVDATSIARLSWVLFIGGGIVFLLVVLVASVALWARRRPRFLSDARFILAAGLVVPTIALATLLVYGLTLTHTQRAAAPAHALRIDVTGELFWWRVRYRLDGRDLDTANEIHVPVGVPVEVTLRSADVIHSFWVPALAGKLDTIPGTVNRLTLTATTPGIYRGQCAEFCGASHAWMAFRVVAVDEAEFEAWLAQQTGPARIPVSADEMTGHGMFLAAGCGGCHTIRGTPANGTIGPDLTHVGSRIGIAADTLPNDAASFARWIRDAQHIKPGTRMPQFRIFSEAELAAIATYLASLE